MSMSLSLIIIIWRELLFRVEESEEVVVWARLSEKPFIFAWDARRSFRRKLVPGAWDVRDGNADAECFVKSGSELLY